MPHGHRNTSTFIAGLRSHAIVAPLVFDGPMNVEISRFYIGEMLATTPGPGDIVVMDSLPARKGTAFNELIGAAVQQS